MAETDQIDVHMGLHARGTTSGGVNENFIPNFADVKAGHNFIVFSGSGTSSGGDANAVAHMFEKWLPQNVDANIYGCYYPEDGGQLAKARADLNASVGLGKGNPNYHSKYTDFFDNMFRELMYDKDGKLKTQAQIAESLRNTTLVGWCHGSTVAYELEAYLTRHLQQSGMVEKDVRKLMKNLSIVNFNPREPVHRSNATVVEVLPLSDRNLERSFNADVVYNKARLTRMANEFSEDNKFLMPDKFYVADEIIGPTVFKNGNRTLLMPTSVMSDDGAITGLPTEHQAISEVLKGRSKQAAQARDVMVDFLDKIMDHKQSLEVDTSYLDRHWEQRKGEMFLSPEATHAVQLARKLEMLEHTLELEYGKIRDIPPERIMPYLSKEEQKTYKELLEKYKDIDPEKTGNLTFTTDLIEFDQKIRQKYADQVPEIKQLKSEIAKAKKQVHKQIEKVWVHNVKQITRPALHLGGRVAAMHVAGHMGRKFREWQDANEHGGGMIALQAEQKSLALQRADQMLATGGVAVMGSGLALAVGQAAGIKALQKGAGKVAAKSVPVLGTVLGVGYAVRRAFDGDWTGVGLELTSAGLDVVSGLGVAASATGVGAPLGVPLATWATGASFAIDASLAVRDGVRHSDGVNYFGLTDRQGKAVMLTDENGTEHQAVGAAITYKNGAKEGQATWYDVANDGSVRPVVAGAYKNNKKDGEWVTYNADGQVCEVAHYANGVQIGEYQRFDKNGQLVASGNITNGDYEEYWLDENGISTGIVKKSGQFKDGKPTGEWYLMDENGKEFTVNSETKSVTIRGSDGKEYHIESDGKVAKWNPETNEIEKGYLNERKEIVWQKQTELVDSIEWNRTHGRSDLHYPTIGDPDYMTEMGMGNSYRNAPPMAVAPEIRFHEENSGVTIDNEGAKQAIEMIDDPLPVEQKPKNTREAASKHGFYGHRIGGMDDLMSRRANYGTGHSPEDALKKEKPEERRVVSSSNRRRKDGRTA